MDMVGMGGVHGERTVHPSVSLPTMCQEAQAEKKKEAGTRNVPWIQKPKGRTEIEEEKKKGGLTLG